MELASHLTSVSFHSNTWERFSTAIHLAGKLPELQLRSSSSRIHASLFLSPFKSQRIRVQGRVLINGRHCAWHVYSGRNPFLSLSILFQGEGAIQSWPLRLTYLRLFPVSLFPSLFFLPSFLSFFLSFFFPYFHEFSQKRHANTRGARRPTNYADRRGGGEKLLEFWLNTVPLMDGASSWRSWKHVIHPADRSTGAPKYELSTRNVALSSAFYIYEHGDSRRGR